MNATTSAAAVVVPATDDVDVVDNGGKTSLSKTGTRQQLKRKRGRPGGKIDDDAASSAEPQPAARAPGAGSDVNSRVLSPPPLLITALAAEGDGVTSVVGTGTMRRSTTVRAVSESPRADEDASNSNSNSNSTTSTTTMTARPATDDDPNDDGDAPADVRWWYPPPPPPRPPSSSSDSVTSPTTTAPQHEERTTHHYSPPPENKMTMTDDEVRAWSESLVGRDWEVYWTGYDENDARPLDVNDGDEVDASAAPAPGAARDSNAASSRSGPGRDDDHEGGGGGGGGDERGADDVEGGVHGADGDGEDDEEEEDFEADWYDVRVESYSPSSRKFVVRFVGDEETPLEMSLSPRIVRPSVVAWSRRTLALLDDVNGPDPFRGYGSSEEDGHLLCAAGGAVGEGEGSMIVAPGPGVDERPQRRLRRRSHRLGRLPPSTDDLLWLRSCRKTLTPDGASGVVVPTPPLGGASSSSASREEDEVYRGTLDYTVEFGMPPLGLRIGNLRRRRRRNHGTAGHSPSPNADSPGSSPDPLPSPDSATTASTPDGDDDGIGGGTGELVAAVVMGLEPRTQSTLDPKIRSKISVGDAVVSVTSVRDAGRYAPPSSDADSSDDGDVVRHEVCTVDCTGASAASSAGGGALSADQIRRYVAGNVRHPDVCGNSVTVRFRRIDAVGMMDLADEVREQIRLRGRLPRQDGGDGCEEEDGDGDEEEFTPRRVEELISELRTTSEACEWYREADLLRLRLRGFFDGDTDGAVNGGGDDAGAVREKVGGSGGGARDGGEDEKMAQKVDAEELFGCLKRGRSLMLDLWRSHERSRKGGIDGGDGGGVAKNDPRGPRRRRKRGRDTGCVVPAGEAVGRGDGDVDRPVWSAPKTFSPQIMRKLLGPVVEDDGTRGAGDAEMVVRGGVPHDPSIPGDPRASSSISDVGLTGDDAAAAIPRDGRIDAAEAEGEGGGSSAGGRDPVTPSAASPPKPPLSPSRPPPTSPTPWHLIRLSDMYDVLNRSYGDPLSAWIGTADDILLTGGEGGGGGGRDAGADAGAAGGSDDGDDGPRRRKRRKAVTSPEAKTSPAEKTSPSPRRRKSPRTSPRANRGRNGRAEGEGEEVDGDGGREGDGDGGGDRTGRSSSSSPIISPCYTLDQIRRHVSKSTSDGGEEEDGVLAKFDLSDRRSRLLAKLGSAERFMAELEGLASRCGEEGVPSSSTTPTPTPTPTVGARMEDDEVVLGLSALDERLRSDPSLANVIGIGAAVPWEETSSTSSLATTNSSSSSSRSSSSPIALALTARNVALNLRYLDEAVVSVSRRCGDDDDANDATPATGPRISGGGGGRRRERMSYVRSVLRAASALESELRRRPPPPAATTPTITEPTIRRILLEAVGPLVGRVSAVFSSTLSSSVPVVVPPSSSCSGDGGGSCPGRPGSSSSVVLSLDKALRLYDDEMYTPGGELYTTGGVRSSLRVLADTVPVVSTVEEKLLVRSDLIRWREKVRGYLLPPSSKSKKKPSFERLLALSREMEDLRRVGGVGITRSSPSRMAVVGDLVPPDADVEEEIERFVRGEIDGYDRAASSRGGDDTGDGTSTSSVVATTRTTTTTRRRPLFSVKSTSSDGDGGGGGDEIEIDLVERMDRLLSNARRWMTEVRDLFRAFGDDDDGDDADDHDADDDDDDDEGGASSSPRCSRSYRRDRYDRDVVSNLVREHDESLGVDCGDTYRRLAFVLHRANVLSERLEDAVTVGVKKAADDGGVVGDDGDGSPPPSICRSVRRELAKVIESIRSSSSSSSSSASAGDDADRTLIRHIVPGGNDTQTWIDVLDWFIDLSEAILNVDSALAAAAAVTERSDNGNPVSPPPRNDDGGEIGLDSSGEHPAAARALLNKRWAEAADVAHRAKTVFGVDLSDTSSAGHVAQLLTSAFPGHQTLESSSASWWRTLRKRLENDERIMGHLHLAMMILWRGRVLSFLSKSVGDSDSRQPMTLHEIEDFVNSAPRGVYPPSAGAIDWGGGGAAETVTAAVTTTSTNATNAAGRVLAAVRRDLLPLNEARKSARQLDELARSALTRAQLVLDCAVEQEQESCGGTAVAERRRVYLEVYDKLKTVQGLATSNVTGRDGDDVQAASAFSLDGDLLSRVEERLRDMAWTARAFSHRCLYVFADVDDESSSEAIELNAKEMTGGRKPPPASSSSSSTRASADVDANADAISWDELVALHESIPSSSSSSSPPVGEGDAVSGSDGATTTITTAEAVDALPAAVSSKDQVTTEMVAAITHLYKQAKEWNDRVSRFLSRTGRVKRTTSPPTKDMDDNNPDLRQGSTGLVVSVEELEDLGSHAILKKVSMPQEESVRERADTARTFRNRLGDFLRLEMPTTEEEAEATRRGGAEDEDHDHLRIATNEKDRHTQGDGASPPPADMAAASELCRELGIIASDLVIVTPETLTMRWIFEVLTWIDGTRDELSDQQRPTVQRAARLLEEGETLFLDVPDDVRASLGSLLIRVAVDPSGALSLETEDGGGDATLLYHGILLFNRLKDDVREARDWEDRSRKAIDRCTSDDFSTSTTYDEAERYDSVNLLVSEARNLKLAPDSGTLALLLDKLKTMNTHLPPEGEQETEEFSEGIGFVPDDEGPPPEMESGKKENVCDSAVEETDVSLNRGNVVEDAGNASTQCETQGISTKDASDTGTGATLSDESRTSNEKISQDEETEGSGDVEFSPDQAPTEMESRKREGVYDSAAEVSLKKRRVDDDSDPCTRNATQGANTQGAPPGSKAYAEQAKNYEDAFSISEDRFELLDSLLGRTTQASCSASDFSLTIDDGPDKDATLRQKNVHFLVKSFVKGMEMFGIEELDEQCFAFCSLLAAKLEAAAFAQCPANEDATRSKYREKLRSLRHNLEDVRNPTLCARVLLGQIDVDELVKMSCEDMASKHTREIRAKAKEDANKNIVLQDDSKKESNAVLAVERGSASAVSDTELPVQPETQNKRHKEKSPSGSAPAKPLLKTLLSSSLQAKEVQEKKAETNVPEMSTPPPAVGKTVRPHLDVSVGLEAIAPHATSPSSEAMNDDDLDDEAMSLTDTERSGSHQTSIASSSSRLNAVNQMSERIIHGKDGSESFAIAINAKGVDVSFSARFFAPTQEVQSVTDWWIPEKLGNKGRLTAYQMNEFVAKKTCGQSIVAILRLSMANTSKSDVHSFKTFYKAFEAADRMAMCEVGPETFLFFVTPKFYSKVTCLIGDGVSRSKRSTYAVVVLPKKAKATDDASETSSLTMTSSPPKYSRQSSSALRPVREQPPSRADAFPPSTDSVRAKAVRVPTIVTTSTSKGPESKASEVGPRQNNALALVEPTDARTSTKATANRNPGCGLGTDSSGNTQLGDVYERKGSISNHISVVEERGRLHSQSNGGGGLDSSHVAHSSDLQHRRHISDSAGWGSVSKTETDADWKKAQKKASDSSGLESSNGCSSGWGSSSKGAISSSGWGSSSHTGGDDSSCGRGASTKLGSGSGSGWGSSTIGGMYASSSGSNAAGGGSTSGVSSGAEGDGSSGVGSGAKSDGWVGLDSSAKDDGGWSGLPLGAKGDGSSAVGSSAKGGVSPVWGSDAKGSGSSGWGSGAKGRGASGWGSGRSSGWGSGTKEGGSSDRESSARGDGSSGWGSGTKGCESSGWGSGAKKGGSSDWASGTKGGSSSAKGGGSDWGSSFKSSTSNGSRAEHGNQVDRNLPGDPVNSKEGAAKRVTPSGNPGGQAEPAHSQNESHALHSMKTETESQPGSHPNALEHSSGGSGLGNRRKETDKRENSGYTRLEEGKGWGSSTPAGWGGDDATCGANNRAHALDWRGSVESPNSAEGTSPSGWVKAASSTGNESGWRSSGVTSALPFGSNETRDVGGTASASVSDDGRKRSGDYYGNRTSGLHVSACNADEVGNGSPENSTRSHSTHGTSEGEILTPPPAYDRPLNDRQTQQLPPKEDVQLRRQHELSSVSKYTHQRSGVAPNSLPILRTKEWMMDYVKATSACKYFSSAKGNGCGHKEKCRYAHIYKPKGPIPQQVPHKDALHYAYYRNFKTGLSNKTDFYQKICPDKGGRNWYTCALKCPVENTIYYAEGQQSEVSDQGIHWYRSYREAMDALASVVLDSFADRKIYSSSSNPTFGSKRDGENRACRVGKIDSLSRPSESLSIPAGEVGHKFMNNFFLQHVQRGSGGTSQQRHTETGFDEWGRSNHWDESKHMWAGPGAHDGPKSTNLDPLSTINRVSRSSSRERCSEAWPEECGRSNNSQQNVANSYEVNVDNSDQERSAMHVGHRRNRKTAADFF